MAPAANRSTSARGILRIDFDEPFGNGDPMLHRISWEEFFDVFDENDSALLRQE